MTFFRVDPLGPESGISRNSGGIPPEYSTKEAALADMVHANRLAAEEELAEKRMMDLMKQEAAAEWHTAVLRRRAKKGVVAVRQSATRSRREALRQVVMKHAELHQTRRMQVRAVPLVPTSL